MRRPACSIFVIICIIVTPIVLFADTIIMNDGNELKGIVVDEYVDRIILSTVEGEKEVLRKDIQGIQYDAPEQNFMQLGRAYDAKGWHDKAAFYYRKAMEISPHYKEAREAYLASHAKMWRQEEKMTRKELERRNIVMDWWRDRYRKDSLQVKDRMSLLKDVLGISLAEKESVFTIEEVIPDSSAGKAGIEEGDLLVGIWGRLIRYSKMEDVLDELLGPKYSEVKVLIEKEISLPTEGADGNLYKESGVTLGFEYEGLVVKDITFEKKGESAGFRKGDLITEIDNNITRYLPLDSVIALINSGPKNNKSMIFTIRRKVNLRREGK